MSQEATSQARLGPSPSVFLPQRWTHARQGHSGGETLVGLGGGSEAVAAAEVEDEVAVGRVEGHHR
mgnify:CR=1 FL=1